MEVKNGAPPFRLTSKVHEVALTESHVMVYGTPELLEDTDWLMVAVVGSATVKDCITAGAAI